jgi:hypothetical protein
MKAAFIYDAEITNAKIANLAVDSAKLDNAAVTTAKIGDAQITSAKIVDANITTAKIADANITLAKINTATITNLSALSANLGTVTAGEVIITKPSSTTPTISGTSMTGVGSRLYSDGRVIFGSPSTNVVFDGSSINFNGFAASARSETTQYSALATPEEKILLTFTIDKTAPVMYGVNTEVRAYAQTLDIVSLMANFRFRLYNSANTLITDIPRTLTSGAYYEPGGNLYRSLNLPFAFQDIKTLAADTYTLVIRHVGSNGTTSSSNYSASTVQTQLNYTVAFYQVLKLN